VSGYLDASAVVSLFVKGVFTRRAEQFVTSYPSALLVSDLAAVEFASVVGRNVRTAEMTVDEGRKSFFDLDEWIERFAQRVETSSTDFRSAERFLRRLDLNLRTQDAIHIAHAQRLGAALVTFDEKMAASARALGLSMLPA